MNRSPIQRVFAISTILGVSAVCSAERPNVLLVSLDTTRADHLSAYGYARDTTPTLEALAREGVVFERAYAPMATTAPSHTTMFTGLYPVTHGVVKNGHELPADAMTLAEYASRAGYATAGIASSYVVAAELGFAQGFEEYRDRFTIEGSKTKFTYWNGQILENGFDQNATETTNKAIDWLNGYAGESRPFFLFVHYFEPHGPYAPPEPYASRYRVADDAPNIQRTVARYNGEIRYTDDEVGRLLAYMRQQGLLDNTVIVVVADHGEAMGEHGSVGHGKDVHEETMRVPFIVASPARIAGGRRITEPVAHVDLLPTLARFMEFTVPDDLPGVDLSPALTGKGVLDPDRPVLLQRQPYGPAAAGKTRSGEHFGVLCGNWKYIVGEEEKLLQLFDLATDPGEQHNVLSAQPGRAEEMAAILDAMLVLHTRANADVAPISEEHREALEALGYIE